MMGFLAGFAFISRMSKHILVEHKIGAAFDDKYHYHGEKIRKIKEEIHAGFKQAVA